jgi:hypothetical protein
MMDEYCDICREHGELVPATVEFCVQREGAQHAQEGGEDAQHVRCCEQHKAQGETAARLMQHNMAPAVLSCYALPAIRA